MNAELELARLSLQSLADRIVRTSRWNLVAGGMGMGMGIKTVAINV